MSLDEKLDQVREDRSVVEWRGLSIKSAAGRELVTSLQGQRFELCEDLTKLLFPVTVAGKALQTRIRLIRDGEFEEDGAVPTQDPAGPPARTLYRLVAQPARVVWVSVDPRNGKPQLYPAEASERLEASFYQHRASVPLAGLGGKASRWLEDVVVDLGGAAPIQRTHRGGKRDVRRIELGEHVEVVTVSVTEDRLAAGPGGRSRWRICDFAAAGVTVEHCLAVHDGSTVASRQPRGGTPKTGGLRPKEPAVPRLDTLRPTLRQLKLDRERSNEVHVEQLERSTTLVRETSARAVAPAHGTSHLSLVAAMA